MCFGPFKKLLGSGTPDNTAVSLRQAEFEQQSRRLEEATNLLTSRPSNITGRLPLFRFAEPRNPRAVSTLRTTLGSSLISSILGRRGATKRTATLPLSRPNVQPRPPGRIFFSRSQAN